MASKKVKTDKVESVTIDVLDNGYMVELFFKDDSRKGYRRDSTRKVYLSVEIGGLMDDVEDALEGRS